MSWDLYLVPADYGQDPGLWLERAGEEGHDVEAARQHAEAVVARCPELELGGPFDFGYQLTLPASSDLPLDVGLYGNHASLSVAYWDLGDRAAELGRLVEQIVTVLADETGWVAYDPQENRGVRLDEIGVVFRTGHQHGATWLAEPLGKPKQEPKKKRRFGLF